jgi:hypothetical protein
MSENLFLAFGLIKSKALACELTLEVQIVNGYTFVRSVDNILTTLSRSELDFFFFFSCARGATSLSMVFGFCRKKSKSARMVCTTKNCNWSSSWVEIPS